MSREFPGRAEPLLLIRCERLLMHLPQISEFRRAVALYRDADPEDGL